MLKNKVAIITGGTRGIGFQIARKFLNNHAKVAIFGSKKESVDIALANLKEENANYEVIGFYPKLADSNEVRTALKQVADHFGSLDILVNNAGISSSTPFLEYSEDEYTKIVDLNIKGVYVCSKEAVSYLKDSKGVILNTSSMVSLYGQPAGVMYPASKFAVNGMTKSLARELAPLGIRVNAVAPGVINTDMVQKLPPEKIEPLIKTIPLGRIGTPEEVANAYLFLASDLASYITGEILSVDGAARS